MPFIHVTQAPSSSNGQLTFPNLEIGERMVEVLARLLLLYERLVTQTFDLYHLN